jgi:hypothetical protein
MTAILLPSGDKTGERMKGRLPKTAVSTLPRGALTTMVRLSTFPVAACAALRAELTDASWSPATTAVDATEKVPTSNAFKILLFINIAPQQIMVVNRVISGTK